MAIPLKYKIILCLGLTHLVLVACGMGHADLSEIPLVGDFFGMYGEATGSSDAYGFFSPGIEGQMTVWFDLEDANGLHTRAQLPTDSNREANLRVGDIIDQFSEPHKSQSDFQRAMTASFAAKMAELHPEARKISVHIDEMKSISMDEYRSGKRMAWAPLYRADFIPPPPHPSKKAAADETGDSR